MRVVQHALQVVHGHERHVGLLQQAHPLGRGALLENPRERAVHEVDVSRAVGEAGEAIVLLGKQLAADRLQEAFPLLVVVDQRADVAVARAVGAPLGRQLARVAAAVQGRLEREPAHMVAEHEGHHGFEHRDVHPVPAAGAPPREKAGQDGAHGRLPHDAIGHGRGHVAGDAARRPRDEVRQRGGALDQVVVGRAGGIRPVLPEAEEARVHDARIDRRYGLVVEPQPRHRLGAHVVHEHVRIREQPLERLRAVGVLQVKHDAALVAVGVQEDRAHVIVPGRADLAHQVTVRRLDLDHVRAHVAQRLRGERSHEHRRHVDDPDAVKRSHAAVRSCSCPEVARCDRPRPGKVFMVLDKAIHGENHIHVCSCPSTLHS